jgi:hypothetical protein
LSANQIPEYLLRDCNNVTEINFEDGFKINEILNDEIEKEKIKMIQLK